MTALSGIALNLRKQLEATPWLRWAAVAIAVLGMAFLWQTVSDVRQRAQQQAIDEESKLRRIRALQGQDVWLTHEQDARQLLGSLEAELPEVATAGLAEAALQAWLRTISSRFNSDQSIRMAVEKSADVASVDNVVKVRATLSGAMTPAEATNVIRQIESAPNLIVIETINITNDASSTVNMSMNAYFRIADPARDP